MSEKEAQMEEQKQEKHIPFGCWFLGSILLVVVTLLIIVVFINTHLRWKLNGEIRHRAKQLVAGKM